MLTLQLGLVAVSIVAVMFAAITVGVCLGYFYMRVFQRTDERMGLAVVGVAGGCNMVVAALFPQADLFANIAVVVCLGFFLWRVYLNIPDFTLDERDGMVMVVFSISGTAVYCACHCITELLPLILAGRHAGIY